MLWYFTCTRNRVPSAHMQSLYLSMPSSKYTSPAELGMRVALNMTDPLRTMLFSCEEKNPKLHLHLHQLYSCKTSSIRHQIILLHFILTALSSMPPPILNSTVRPMMLTPSFPRMMALLSPLMVRSDAALLVIWNQRQNMRFVNTIISIHRGLQSFRLHFLPHVYVLYKNYNVKPSVGIIFPHLLKIKMFFLSIHAQAAVTECSFESCWMCIYQLCTPAFSLRFSQALSDWTGELWWTANSTSLRIFTFPFWAFFLDRSRSFRYLFYSCHVEDWISTWV